MTVLLATIEGWNWNDFAQTVLGALLGFVFAIGSSAIFAAISRLVDCGAIKKSICVEFKTILNNLETINFDKQFVEPISVAYWDSLVSGNKFSLLYRVSWYPDVSSCYMKIKIINEQIKVRNAQKLEASTMLDSAKREIANVVVEEIQKNIQYQCNSANVDSIAAMLTKVIASISKKNNG